MRSKSTAALLALVYQLLLTLVGASSKSGAALLESKTLGGTQLSIRNRNSDTPLSVLEPAIVTRALAPFSIVLKGKKDQFKAIRDIETPLKLSLEFFLLTQISTVLQPLRRIELHRHAVSQDVRWMSPVRVCLSFSGVSFFSDDGKALISQEEIYIAQKSALSKFISQFDDLLAENGIAGVEVEHVALGSDRIDTLTKIQEGYIHTQAIFLILWPLAVILAIFARRFRRRKAIKDINSYWRDLPRAKFSFDIDGNDKPFLLEIEPPEV